MARKQTEKDNAAPQLQLLPDAKNGEWMEPMHTLLNSSQKKGLFGSVKANSDEYNAILNGLTALDGVMDVELGATHEQRQAALMLAYQGYQTLIEACERYVNDADGNVRSASTETGRVRIIMVQRVKELAERDAAGLMTQMFQAADLQATTVKEAVGQARTRVVEMNGTDKEHAHVGGLASNLTVLDEKETGGKGGFFGERKVLDRDLKKNREAIVIQAAERTGLSREKLLQARAVLGEPYGDANSVSWTDKLRKSDLSQQDADIKKFADTLFELGKGLNTSYSNIFQSEYANVKADQADMGARNVASSRVAELLGVGRLIAKSETVELREKGQTTGRVGNLMEKAEGEEAKKVYISAIGDKLEKQGMAKANNADIANAMKGMITGSYQRDMADLQVLDYLCGQIDRHFQNYFIRTNAEGQFTGVQGIDNDLSFGDALRKEDKTKHIMGAHGREVVTEDGELYIPHMSRELAVTINGINEKMLRYALIDLIDTPDLDAFCKRLRLLKTAIAKELAKNPRESKLRNANEWNNETLNNFLNADAATSTGDRGTSNYVGTSILIHASRDAFSAINAKLQGKK